MENTISIVYRNYTPCLCIFLDSDTAKNEALCSAVREQFSVYMHVEVLVSLC